MVFYLNLTDRQYGSQKSKVPMGPKQPGTFVLASLFRDVLIHCALALFSALFIRVTESLGETVKSSNYLIALR